MRIPCLNRLEGNRHAICLHVDHPFYKRKVGPKTCRECPESARLVKVLRSTASAAIPSERPQEAHEGDVAISPLGTLIYTRTQWEAPPTPPGYRSRSSDAESDDAWILDPMDVVCRHLELVPADRGSCGYQRVARRCRLIDSFVGARTCMTCEKKEEIDAR